MVNKASQNGVMSKNLGPVVMTPATNLHPSAVNTSFTVNIILLLNIFWITVA